MSSDTGNSTTNTNEMPRQRRASITSSAFTNLFRSNSTSQPTATPFPTPLASTAVNDQRRRLSVTTIGLSGTSPTSTSAFLRRTSLSTNSDSIDENAIEDDETSSRTAPVTPLTRRMSFGAAQAMRGARSATSPGTNDQGFNWSEQLRSRAESTVASGSRPSFSFASGLGASPPQAAPPVATRPHTDRAKSFSDMPAPPAQPPRPRAPQKPDPFQERILKGDFYLD
ncbi:hypothetical protein VTG60DRAFT_2988 [Thermothelomyces hinnuleus]